MPRTTIRTEDITDREVSAAKIVEASIGAFELASDSVSTAELANDVVISTSGAITTTGAFTSVGIDDNADATAMTIDSSENIGIGVAPIANERLTINGHLNVGTISGEPGLTSSIATMWGGDRTINAGATLHLMTNTSAAADKGGSLNLGGNYSGTANSIDFAQIAGRSEVGGTLGYMSLSTRSSAAETEKVRIDSDGNMKMSGNGSIAINTVANLSDDSVTSFTPSSNRGMIFAGGSSTHMGAAGYVCINGGGQEAYLLLNATGLFAVGTGVPTGTTGTDVRFTIFAASDGKIYFENRLGGSYGFWYFTMGLPW